MAHVAEQASIAALDRILGNRVQTFALLHRPESTESSEVEVLLGEVSEVPDLEGLSLPPTGADHHGTACHDLLVLVPYRQIAERGFACVDDGTPLLTMKITEQDAVPVELVIGQLPDLALEVTNSGFDISDDRYAELVRHIVAQEIGRGEGANFVLRRSFVATINNYTPQAALAVFRRLLISELSAYWTFLVHTGSRTLLGATPEKHVSLSGGTVVMNPISGTYRYPPSGPSVSDALCFLADPKEIDELHMVVDEELKMMAKVCSGGGRVVGPYLKEMSRLAHTEYLLEGRSSLDVREILHETMFAPTVTGSPLESACRVLARYEPEGRGYYSGVLALIGRDQCGNRVLDSSILIRTADIAAGGEIRIGVGATLVRHSDPDSEVAETTAKAAGLLAAIQGGAATIGQSGSGQTAATPAGVQRLGSHAEVVRALQRRNSCLARFWFDQPTDRSRVLPHVQGRRVLVVDAEDTFTEMLGLQLAALGPLVSIRRFDEPYQLDAFDLIVVGPGPGDPREHVHHKIAVLRDLTERLLSENRPFVSVCLGHQVLAELLGFTLVRKEVPNQGLQREIDVFGQRRRVGFYNTFAALFPHDEAELPDGVQASWDPASHEVHALRGPGFRSMQFHPESVLTEDGVDIFHEVLTSLLHTSVPTDERPVRPGGRCVRTIPLRSTTGAADH